LANNSAHELSSALTNKTANNMHRASKPRRFDVQTLRSWLFVEGGNEQALHDAAHSAGDVLIQELEDFTPPTLRTHAQPLSVALIAKWRAAGKVTAVRINPLNDDGLADLRGAMPAHVDMIMLPKAESAEQIIQLDKQISQHEDALGIEQGHTALVPNVESARGLLNTVAIVQASSRAWSPLKTWPQTLAPSAHRTLLNLTMCVRAFISSAPPPQCYPSTVHIHTAMLLAARQIH
jgi:hypothetical protein